MRRQAWVKWVQLVTVVMWSLFPPFYSPMPAAWVPSATDPMVPVWEGAEPEPASGPDWEDSDSDGLPNWFEAWLGTSPGNPDSDYDGISDSDECFLTGTDPLNWDSDGDGVSDHDAWHGCWAVNHHVAGFGQALYDWDGDGLYNHEDPFPFDPNNEAGWVDSDGDNVADGADSHPWDSTLWNDWDGDGVNDDTGSGPSGMDSDGDGHEDSADSHPDDPLLWSDWDQNGVNDHEETPDPHTTDSDGDGHFDAYDSHPWNPALWNDLNYNGINDDEETGGTEGGGGEPGMVDSDADGLTDDEEVNYGTDPHLADSDGDGLTDFEELRLQPASDPLNAHSLSQAAGFGDLYTDWQMNDTADTDGDGIPDRIEELYGLWLDPGNPHDGGWDADGDGTSNLQAYLNGWVIRASINPLDRDGDGITDIQEENWSSLHPGLMSKFRFSDAVADGDNDGLMNYAEILQGSDPGEAESLYPGVSDLTVWAWTGSCGQVSADAPLSHLTASAALSAANTSAWLDENDINENGIPDGLEAFITAVGVDGVRGRAAGADFDGDGMPDVWEWRYREKLDPMDGRDAGVPGQPIPVPPNPPNEEDYLDASSGTVDYSAFTAAQSDHQAALAAYEALRYDLLDPDNDGLCNLHEFQLNTSPLLADSDGDGVSDGLEVAHETDPADGSVLPPLVLTVLSGDGQVVAADETMAEPLILRATRAGLSAVGVAVSATASGGALSSSFDGPRASSKVVSTNVNGEVAFLWQPPAASGTWTVQVVAAGAGGKTFHLTTTMPTLVMTVTGGQGQAAEVGTVAAQPLAVQIGRGSLSMTGLPVTFTAAGGQGEVAASVAGPWQSSVTVPANAQGHAEVYWKAPATAGGYGVQASVTAGTGADAATVEQGFALQAFAPGGGTGGTGGSGGNGGNGNTGGPVPGRLEMKIWERTMDFVTGLSETSGTFYQLEGENGYWAAPEWVQRLQLAFSFSEENDGRILFEPDASYYEVRAGAPLSTIASETGFSTDDDTVKLAEAEAAYFLAGLAVPSFGYPTSSQGTLIQYHDQPSTDRRAHERRIKYVVTGGELQTEQSVAYLVRYRSESYAAGSGPPIEKWFTVTFTAPEGANPGAAANVSIKGLLLEATACGITTSGNELHLNPPPIQNGKSELSLLPIDIEEVISDQIAGNNANKLPTAYFGGNPSKPCNGHPNNPMLMATRSGQTAKLKVKMASADRKVFVGARKIGTTAILGSASASNTTVDLDVTVPANSHDTYEVVAGYDANGNSKLDDTEVAVVFEKTPRKDKDGNPSTAYLNLIDKIVIVDASQFATSKAQAISYSNIWGSGFAGDLLVAFANGSSVIAGTTTTSGHDLDASVIPSADGLSHPLGANWGANNHASTHRFEFPNGSNASQDIISSSGMSNLFDQVINDNISTLITNAGAETGTVRSDPITFSGYSVNFAQTDPYSKLHVGIGKGTFSGDLTVIYRVIGDAQIEVEMIELADGRCFDLYDFAYGAKPIKLLWLTIDPKHPVMVQAGHATLATGNAGKVFFTQFQFETSPSFHFPYPVFPATLPPDPCNP